MFEELYAEDPSRFMKWMRDLGDSFGHGLAVFCKAAMDGADWPPGSPWRVFGGENRGTQWLEKSGDPSLEFYQQQMDAAVAAMGDSAGWSKGAQVMSGFSTAFEMFLTVGIGASLIGKLTAGTAAAPLSNYKTSKSIPTISSVPVSSAEKANNLIKKLTDHQDNNLYRRTKNMGDFYGLKEAMELKNVKNIANKAGIGLQGIKIQIIRDPTMIGSGYFGWTSADGKFIQLYPDAFSSTQSLVTTLGHERMHVYQTKVFGTPISSELLIQYENAATVVENYLWEYYLKGTR
jgi:hypothetical protein